MSRACIFARLAALATCALFLAGTAGPVLAQTLGQGEEDGISIWRVLGALMLCLMLAVAGALAIRARLGDGGALPRIVRRERRLRLVESLRISHQVDLCIVTCDGRELLLAASAHGVDELEHVPVEKANAQQPDSIFQ